MEIPMARKKLEKMMDDLSEIAKGSKAGLCHELEQAHQHIHMAYIEIEDKICLEVTEAEARALLKTVIAERARLWKFVDRRPRWGKKVRPKLLANLDTLDRLVVKLGEE